MKFCSLRIIILFFLLVISQTYAQVENLSGVDSTIYISHTIFLPKYSVVSGQEPWSVAAADFDGNGTIDLASCSQVDSKINIHLNDGKGNLSPAKSFSTGNSPRAIYAQDFNKDGKPDLATVSIKDGKLNWHINQGNGNFNNIQSFNTGIFPHWVTSGDYNHDGNYDLITVSNSENKVYLFAGNGKGQFSFYKSFLTGEKPRKVVVQDMNKDGKNDIITSCDDGFVYIYYGNGADFVKGSALPCGGHAVWGFEVADINKDGLPDVVAATYLGNNIYWFHNRGNKTFQAFEPVMSGAMNFDIVLDDFDLDGDIDAITASSRDQNVNVHLNDGKGHFGPRSSFRSGNWNARILGYDMDGDGDKDIITASFKDNSLNVHRNISIDPENKKAKDCSIEGVVYDLKTKKTLQAVVSLVDESGKTINGVKTDIYGKYHLKVPCEKKYRLIVKAPDYPEFSEKVTFPKEDSHIQKDVYLDREVEGFVFGKIRDAKTLKPLEAVIIIKDIYGKIQFQEKLSEYKKVLPFARGYKIEVSAEGYYPQSTEFAIYEKDAKIGVEKNFDLIPIEKAKIAKIKGTVYDKDTKEKLADAQVKVVDSKNNILQQMNTLSDGSFEFVLPFGTYVLEANKKMYLFNSVKVSLTDKYSTENPLIQDIPLSKMELDKVFVIDNIYYDYDKATLRKESITVLEKLVNIMQENPNIHIEISGHTDSDGSDEYNLKLSDARAKSVVDYLIKSGIDANRLTWKGYGESKPVAPNDTPVNKQKKP
ncbi:MAG: hypothetical protein KatS3mg035_0306 [Bacteroidia bacterium]|nr:MAG: hypothetical protein KatS3mg035_0306 [Bacteroidia bacterium]